MRMGTLPIADAGVRYRHSSVATLEQLIAAGTRPTELVRICVEACRAVEFAHGHGVIHPTLSASTIAVGEYGEVFVLAPQHPRSDLEPKYASHLVDVFALGCILASICAIDPHDVPALADIARTATATEPGDRQQSAGVLADQLLAAVDDDAPTDSLPKSEIEAIVAAGDEATVRRDARVATFAYLGYLTFVPAIFLKGQPAYAIALILLVALNMTILRLYAHTSTEPSRVPLVIGNAALCALVARMSSPFLVAPALATVTTMALALSPSWKNGRQVVALIVVMASALLIPYAGERLGWWPATVRPMADGIAITGATIRPSPSGQLVVLCVFVVSVVSVAGGLGYAFRRSERNARRRLIASVWAGSQRAPRA